MPEIERETARLTMLDAAKRELFEEVGRDDLPIGPCILKRDVEFEWEEWHVRHHQWTFLVEAPDEFEARVLHPDEEPIVGSAWHSVGELRALTVDVYPEGLIDLVSDLTTDPPDPLHARAVVEEVTLTPLRARR